MKRVAWTSALDPRRVMIANALGVSGYHGSDPATHAAFDDLLGPPGHWPLRKAYGKGGVSTCAMVALGLLRRAGVACPAIADGYDVATGLDVAITFARLHGAWMRYAPGRVPLPGDVVQVLGPMHVLTVIELQPHRTLGIVCRSIDGGQVHPRDGLQCIARVTRPWTTFNDARVPYAKIGARRVDGWIDVSRLPFVGEALVPEDFEP